MARYMVSVERTTVETADVEVEVPDGLDPDDVDWPRAIEEHLDAAAEAPGSAPIDWETELVDYDVEGGTEPEPVT